MEHVVVAGNVQPAVANKREATKKLRYLSVLGSSVNTAPNVQMIKPIQNSYLMKIKGREGSEKVS